MRRGNENTILAQLRREPDLPGSTIAKKTGLAPQTVSVLLRHLETNGLIARNAVLRGRRGQPAVPFHLRGEAACAIGVECSWQHYDFVLLDLSGRIVPGGRITYALPDPDRIVDDLVSGVDRLLAEIPRHNTRILGIGLTGPSTLAKHAWAIGASEQTCQRLGDIDLGDELTKRTTLPVSTSNDGTSALWSETAFGRVPPDLDCAYVFLSTFIGSALCVDGRVLKGRNVNNARIGAAMYKQPDGTVSNLHRTYSVWALAEFLTARGHHAPAHDLSAWDWNAIEPAFAGWLDGAAETFALAFANASAVVGVPVLIMDGILPRSVLARLINAIQTRINALPMDTLDTPLVLLGNSGPSAPAIGAAYKLLHERYFDA